jgi:hypothetical protein
MTLPLELGSFSFRCYRSTSCHVADLIPAALLASFPILGKYMGRTWASTALQLLSHPIAAEPPAFTFRVEIHVPKAAHDFAHLKAYY